MNKRPYLILGNSAAAIGGVAGIRETDPTTPITLIAREPEHTYSRPLISYLLAGKVDDEHMFYRERDFYEKNGVEAVLGVEAVRVDVERRTVRTADGRDFAFDKLLIATGGKPVIPKDLPGADAEGVFTFTTWEDARKVRRYVAESRCRRAVVVGGGLIGLKSVEALVKLGMETTVVELADRILSQTFDKTASDLALESLRNVGVDVFCGTTAVKISTSGARVSSVMLRDGRDLPCDLVILAIGVVPDTRLVEGTSIRVDRGILTNERMETTAKGIYAAGDVAQAHDLLSGKSRTIPILPNACRQGAVAGANMAGAAAVYKGGIVMNAVDICGLPTISVGISAPEGAGYEVLSDVDRETRAYRKFVLKDDRIVGAIFVGQIDRAGITTGLIREKVDVSGVKDLLLSQDFGVISLPKDYRKHVVSGTGIEV